MKKGIALFLGCLAYFSVHAQENINAETLAVTAKERIAEIQRTHRLTEEQESVLLDYFVYLEKENAGKLTTDSKANPPKDVNMEALFDEKLLALIQKNASQITTTTRIRGTQQKRGF